MDIYLFHSINGLPHPAWVDEIAIFLDWFGRINILLLMSCALILLGLALKKKKLWLGALILGLGLLITGILTTSLKQMIDRPRPQSAMAEIYFVGHSKGASFPSGHATRYAVLGAFMIYYFRRAKWFWIALIFFGSVGRVYQGTHYPSDILGGWALAALIVCFMIFSSKYFENRVT